MPPEGELRNVFIFPKLWSELQNIWCPSFLQFLLQNVWYCFCYIYEITTPLCPKFSTEVSSSVIYPTPQFWVELVSASGTYAKFPKVTYFRTVQDSELVQTSTCHCFTFGVWNFYHRKYILCVRIINPPLSKFGHMYKSGVMSKSGVHPVYL